jgi:type IV fimbrial biogenesis protein FimT
MRQSNQCLAIPAARSRCIKSQGFSLVELVVAMAIMGILITITLPAMDSILLNGRLRSYSNELLASAYLARSEAIKTNTVVRLCASASGTACDGSWEQGWVVIRSDDAVIESHAALKEGFVINGSVTTVSFKPTGIGATQATLTICKSGGDQSRLVTVNASGRPSVTKETGGC